MPVLIIVYEVADLLSVGFRLCIYLSTRWLGTRLNYIGFEFKKGGYKTRPYGKSDIKSDLKVVQYPLSSLTTLGYGCDYQI